MAPAVSQAPEVQARRSRVVGGASGQRARLVRAMGELVAEVGLSAVGVHHVCQRAGMSRRTFYEHYEGRDACFMETLREAFDRLLGRVDTAVTAAGPDWEDRAVATTRALVGALEADRVLARVCVVSALGGGEDAIALRRETLNRLAAPLRDVSVPGPATELVLASALGGVWELVHRRLTDDPGASLTEIGEAADYLMLSPFVGRRRATALAGQGSAIAFVTRWSPQVAGADHPGLVVTELTRQTLSYLDAHPGACNVEIARGVDVRHESQISRHLVRLERAGIVRHRKEGRTNAWTLTDLGREAAGAVLDLGDGSHR